MGGKVLSMVEFFYLSFVFSMGSVKKKPEVNIENMYLSHSRGPRETSNPLRNRTRATCVGCWYPNPSAMRQLLLNCVYFSLLKTLIRPFDTRYLRKKASFDTMLNFYLSKEVDLLSKHRWFSGRMLACHAGGPGSIPGRCNFLLSSN